MTRFVVSLLYKTFCLSIYIKSCQNYKTNILEKKVKKIDLCHSILKASQPYMKLASCDSKKTDIPGGPKKKRSQN